MKNKLALATLTLVPFSVLSEEAKTDEKPAFTASAEFGALYRTGNTTSGDIKTGIAILHEKAQWRSSAKFDMLVRKTEETDENGNEELTTTDQRWSIDAKTNYTLSASGKNYLYGNAYYTEDRFNGFENQTSLSAGWGRRWVDTEKTKFDADIGPGFKSDVVTATDSTPEETRNSLIIQAQGLFTHQLNENVEFRQLLSAKYATKSGENSIYKSETSIITKLIETLQLKFAITVDHNTDVEADRENTDTQTSMTIVYSF